MQESSASYDGQKEQLVANMIPKLKRGSRVRLQPHRQRSYQGGKSTMSFFFPNFA